MGRAAEGIHPAAAADAALAALARCCSRSDAANCCKSSRCVPHSLLAASASSASARLASWGQQNRAARPWANTGVARLDTGKRPLGFAARPPPPPTPTHVSTAWQASMFDQAAASMPPARSGQVQEAQRPCGSKGMGPASFGSHCQCFKPGRPHALGRWVCRHAGREAGRQAWAAPGQHTHLQREAPRLQAGAQPVQQRWPAGQQLTQPQHKLKVVSALQAGAVEKALTQETRPGRQASTISCARLLRSTAWRNPSCLDHPARLCQN